MSQSNSLSRSIALMLLAFAAGAPAHAGYETADGQLRLSGFGTVGLSRTNTDDVLFNYPGQGGGSNTNWHAAPDTKLAVQGRYKFTPDLSGTVQVMTKFRPEGRYEPSAEWAFLKWQATEAWSFRAGRLGVPLFMLSDSKDIGDAYPQVRPPLDVYGQVPQSQFEGLDASHQATVGPATLTTSLWMGEATAHFSWAERAEGMRLPVSTYALKQARGLNLTADIEGGLSLRAGYSEAHLTVPQPELDPLLNSGDADLRRNTLDNLAVNNRWISYSGVGASYVRGNWTASAEFSMLHSDSPFPDTHGWYLTIGHRFGRLTPFVGMSRQSLTSLNKTNPYADSLTDPSAAGDIARAFQARLDAGKTGQHTLTLGARIDPRPDMALKVQWDRVTKPAGAYGQFRPIDLASPSTQAFFNEERRINVLSVALDFVF